jgi:hypothetical protein
VRSGVRPFDPGAERFRPIQVGQVWQLSCVFEDVEKRLQLSRGSRSAEVPQLYPRIVTLSWQKCNTSQMGSLSMTSLLPQTVVYNTAPRLVPVQHHFVCAHRAAYIHRLSAFSIDKCLKSKFTEYVAALTHVRSLKSDRIREGGL